MRVKLIQGAFLLLCLALCLSLSLGYLLRGPSQAGANETRAAAPSLRTASGGVNWQFPAEAAAYFESRFFLRQELISGRSKLLAGLLGSSPDESVIVGSQGWLYYGETLDDYTGAALLSQRELFAAARNLALLQDHCSARGVNLLFTAAPNKNALYPEHMPRSLPRAQTSNAAELYRLLAAEGVAYLDLHQLLGSQPDQLYFAHDSHWTSQGAALAADGINRCLGRESHYAQGPIQETAHDGDLYAMLYPAIPDKECDRAYGNMLTYSYEGASRADSITLRTHGQGQGRLLCYRDSFGNLLHPYLADSFAEARFSRSTTYDLSGLEAGDCLVIELVERNLDYLLDNVPCMPAPEQNLAAPAAQASEPAALTGEQSGAPAGYLRWSGQLPAAPDAQARVYLLAGGQAYECFLGREDRFAASLPEDLTPEAVVTEVDGVLTAFPVRIQTT